jgi:hypothetical protein
MKKNGGLLARGNTGIDTGKARLVMSADRGANWKAITSLPGKSVTGISFFSGFSYSLNNIIWIQFNLSNPIQIYTFLLFRNST